MTIPETPITRTEMYLNEIVTGEPTKPAAPITRIEQYLDVIASGGIATKIETVTGTDPEITGTANTIYICGEVDTLSITPPESGIIDVVFESGSTPTVLTLPNTVVMPDWWTGVEASRIYEISIMDGTLAVVTSWAAS